MVTFLYSGSSPNYEIVAVASRREEYGKQLANEFGIPHVFREPAELIGHPNVNLVVVLPPGAAARSASPCRHRGGQRRLVRVATNHDGRRYRRPARPRRESRRSTRGGTATPEIGRASGRGRV